MASSPQGPEGREEGPEPVSQLMAPSQAAMKRGHAPWVSSMACLPVDRTEGAFLVGKVVSVPGPV